MSDGPLCARCLEYECDIDGADVFARDNKGVIVVQSWCIYCEADHAMYCTVCGDPHDEELITRSGACLTCQTVADDLRYDAIGDTKYEDAVHAAIERRHEQHS